MTIAYLNGTFLPLKEAKISPLDRGFLFGDGIYEIIPCYNRKLFYLEAHLERLDHSLKAIELSLPLDHRAWEAIITQLISKNSANNQKIYLQITRGATDNRNHSFSKETPLSPTVFAFAAPFEVPTIDDLKKGGKAITLPDPRWLHCHIKSINLLPNILSYETGLSQGAQETILIRDGKAIEGASSNLFIVRNETLITPPLTNAILAGITRKLVLELAKKLNITIKEIPIPKEELFTASEVWITSSTREILPIIQVDNTLINQGKVGPLWEQMIHHYQKLKME